MLILEYTSLDGICRVNVLPAIATEAMAYYRTVLVASFLRVQLFSMPFHRDIPLDSSVAGRLSDEIRRCKMHRGCFLVTAQQRNSLLLKQYDQGTVVEGLKEDFVDILDESDAILHHDFQLVYALARGPRTSSRWVLSLDCTPGTAQNSFCQQKRRDIDDLERRFPCAQGNEYVWIISESACPASFQKPRSLAGDFPLERAPRKSSKRTTLDERRAEQGDRHACLYHVGPVPRRCTSKYRGKRSIQRKRSYILAARGFIAFGLLFHGLEARYCLNYGLKPKLSTDMAVCRSLICSLTTLLY